MFRRFCSRQCIQNRRFFDYFSKTLILQKSCSRLDGSSIFQVSSKNDQKSMPKSRSKKTSKKTSQKSMLASVLASQNHPKSLQNRPGARKNRVSNEACFATLWSPPANRRKVTGVGVCKASKGLRIWLGLLYLSIYLSIYWSAPRRPNHQSKVCNLTCSTHISAHPTRQSKNTV